MLVIVYYGRRIVGSCVAEVHSAINVEAVKEVARTNNLKRDGWLC